MFAHTQSQIHNYPIELRSVLQQTLYDSITNTQMIHAAVNSETTNFCLHAIKSSSANSSNSNDANNTPSSRSSSDVPHFLKSIDFSSSRSVPDLVYLQQNLHVFIGNRLLNDCKAFNYNYLHSVHRFADWGDLCGNILYIHQKGTITSCHNDDMNNLYCQIKGKKLFLLASPRYYSSLYPAPVNHPIDRQSLVNIRCPDLQQFPKFTETQFLYAILEPGETLFIPASWFHYSETPYEETIALNFWFFHNAPPPNMPSSPTVGGNSNLALNPSITLPALVDESSITTTIRSPTKGSKGKKKLET